MKCAFCDLNFFYSILILEQKTIRLKQEIQDVMKIYFHGTVVFYSRVKCEGIMIVRILN